MARTLGFPHRAFSAVALMNVVHALCAGLHAQLLAVETPSQLLVLGNSSVPLSSASIAVNALTGNAEVVHRYSG